MEKGDTIGDLYQRRVPLYEKYADITVKADGLAVEQTVEQIVAYY